MKKHVMDLRLLAMAFLSLTNFSLGEDWAGWRGTRGDGISLESKAPLHWSQTEGIRWSVAVPGVGHSSPIVVRDSVFLTTCDKQAETRSVLRFDRDTGAIQWNKVVHTAPFENQHQFNTSASSTPTSDGAFIFSLFADDKELVAIAIDWAGETKWKRSLGTFFSKHGFASSPVLCESGLLINGHQDGQAFVSLLNPKTGDEVWRYQPDVKLRSFSTPLVVNVNGEKQVILSGAHQTLGLNPATGSRTWFVTGPTEKVVCTPSVGLGHIFSFGGSPEARAFAIRLGGKQDVTSSHIVWQKERGMPYVPTPLLYGQWLHVIDDGGVYTCIEPVSGRVASTKRKGGNTYSSPIGVADRVYLFEDSGSCTVIANDDSFRVLAKNDLGELVQTTPAFSNGSMYVRSESHLWRMDEVR